MDISVIRAHIYAVGYYKMGVRHLHFNRMQID